MLYFKSCSSFIALTQDFDEARFIDSLENILKHFNYRCTKAYNGTDALKLLEKHTFETVLLDVGLPDISGCDIAKFIHTKYASTTVMKQNRALSPISIKYDGFVLSERLKAEEGRLAPHFTRVKRVHTSSWSLQTMVLVSVSLIWNMFLILFIALTRLAGTFLESLDKCLEDLTSFTIWW